MLNPSIGKLLNNYESRYSLVIAISKRARKIAVEAEVVNDHLSDKPVNIALNEMAEGKFFIKEIM